MMQQHNKKKKKRSASRASKPISLDGGQGQQSQRQQNPEQRQEGTKVVEALMEAFDSISVEEAEEAYREAKGDINKAAQILENFMENSEDPSTSSFSSGLSGFGLGSSTSSSAGSSSASRDGFLEGNLVNRKGFRGGNKQKRVLAVTGTVSTVLGKEYVKVSPRRDSMKAKDFGNGVVEKEEAEQFLCSMLGNDCELSMGVVRDVLCQCGYDVEKALDVLLDLSASSHEQSRSGRHVKDSVNYKEDARFLAERSDNSTDVASDCTSHSSESELQDSVWGCGYRNYYQALTSFKAPSSTTPISNESNLPQKVLECLFNVPTSSEHEPSTMNWRNVVKKMQSLGPAVDVFPSIDALTQQNNYANGEEYHLLRESAKRHWNSRTSYYQKAAAAYSKGERGYAAYLSDQGRIQTKLAQEADKKASQDIFKARNKGITNVITIDLHGQHVKQAMRVLKLHLLFGTYVRSIQTLRVITGCGSRGLGKSKVKQAVTRLLENEGIEWSEENQGVLLIKIDGYKEYSFPDIDSDTD
ncbi:hypothetical protein Peur_074182 [Populus x canadensis]|uniref:Smr domain-containing protein n=1 Tax=Populus deltoides TaxID=3696 RepID=A0A8T2Y1P7_POPDE|nr:hypothetical protein H0E87_017810 [Populus deltoides]